MALHRMTVLVDVNDELLADHDGEQKPPPNDVEEWDFRDIERAIEEGIVDPAECEVVSYDGVVEEKPEASR